MGCKCGSQIILCNLPVRFDTYRGCSHGCRYCFAQKKNDISHIERDESVDGLRSFIEGKRGNETEWCDWNIPIHWGGMSCLLYTSPSPRDGATSRMPSSA